MTQPIDHSCLSLPLGFIIRGWRSGPFQGATELRHKWIGGGSQIRSPNNPTPVSVTYEHSSLLLVFPFPYPAAWVVHIGGCNNTGSSYGVYGSIETFWTPSLGGPRTAENSYKVPDSTPI